MLLEKNYDSGETRVRIPLTRLYGNSILTIYIPSLILMIISYLTLFFRTSIFDVRVMVALTALLVLATLFAQVRNFYPFVYYLLISIFPCTMTSNVCYLILVYLTHTGTAVNFLTFITLTIQSKPNSSEYVLRVIEKLARKQNLILS